MSEWIRFGRYGLTAPLTTEHMGKCRYHPQKRFCDLPVDCHNRVPSKLDQMCREMPQLLGF